MPTPSRSRPCRSARPCCTCEPDPAGEALATEAAAFLRAWEGAPSLAPLKALSHLAAGWRPLPDDLRLRLGALLAAVWMHHARRRRQRAASRAWSEAAAAARSAAEQREFLARLLRGEPALRDWVAGAAVPAFAELAAAGAFALGPLLASIARCPSPPFPPARDGGEPEPGTQP